MFVVLGTDLENYDKKYRGNKKRAIDDWKMRKKYKELYEKDPKVRHIGMKFNTTNWWSWK